MHTNAISPEILFTGQSNSLTIFYLLLPNILHEMLLGNLLFLLITFTYPVKNHNVLFSQNLS